jgi:hypothetical protein
MNRTQLRVTLHLTWFSTKRKGTGAKLQIQRPWINNQLYCNDWRCWISLQATGQDRLICTVITDPLFVMSFSASSQSLPYYMKLFFILWQYAFPIFRGLFNNWLHYLATSKKQPKGMNMNASVRIRHTHSTCDVSLEVLNKTRRNPFPPRRPIACMDDTWRPETTEIFSAIYRQQHYYHKEYAVCNTR